MLGYAMLRSLLGILAKVKVFGCVASTFTFGLGCGHCFGIRSIVSCAGFVLSLHREVGGVRQYR